MRDISFFNKIYIATNPVDFRKQDHGLAMIVEHSLGCPITATKYLYVFTNKKKSAVKILYWNDTGFALWWKTLEKIGFVGRVQRTQVAVLMRSNSSGY